MNKRERTIIAHRLLAIAERHGAIVEIDLDRSWRSIHFLARFPLVHVSIDIDNLHRGGLLASWHRAEQPLALAPFDSVNECHRHKATQYRDSASEFYPAFEHACAAVADSSAFLTSIGSGA